MYILRLIFLSNFQAEGLRPLTLTLHLQPSTCKYLCFQFFVLAPGLTHITGNTHQQQSDTVHTQLSTIDLQLDVNVDRLRFEGLGFIV